MRCHELKQKTASFQYEPECNQRQTGSVPGKQCALSGEEDSGVCEIGHRAQTVSSRVEKETDTANNPTNQYGGSKEVEMISTEKISDTTTAINLIHFSLLLLE